MEIYGKYVEEVHNEVDCDKDIYPCLQRTLDAYIEDGDRSMIRTIETDPFSVLLKAKRKAAREKADVVGTKRAKPTVRDV